MIGIDHTHQETHSSSKGFGHLLDASGAFGSFGSFFL